MFYVFKLNVSRYTIKKFETENLLFQAIEDSLKDSFNCEEQHIGEEIKLLKCNFFDSNVIDNMYQDFSELEGKILNFIDLYKDVCRSYKETNSIIYSTEFLTTNEQLSEEKKKYIRKYKMYIQDYGDEFVEKNSIEFLNNKIGTGNRLIRDYFKIKQYLVKNDYSNFLNIKVYYYPDKEYLLIEENNQDIAKDISKSIEYIIRNTNNDILKEVIINPIYDKIILKKDYNKVTFTFIYPNGNPSANRWETFAEETHAREVSGMAKGDHLNTELINSDITEQAKKGYYLGSSNVESLTIKSIANLSKNIKFL